MQRKKQEEEERRISEEKRKEEDQKKRAEDKRRAEREEQDLEEKKRMKEQLDALKKEEKKKKGKATSDAVEVGGKELEAVDDDDLRNIDKDALIKAKKAQEEKLKREAEERMQLAVQKLDHLERARRENERPLHVKEYEKQKEQDKQRWEVESKQFMENHAKKHAEDVEAKKRMKRMQADAIKYEEMVIARRKTDFEREKAAYMQKAKADKERSRREREEKMRKQREEDERKEKEEEERRLKAEEERKRREEEVCHFAALPCPPVSCALQSCIRPCSILPAAKARRMGLERDVERGLLRGVFGAGEAVVSDFVARHRCPLVELRLGRFAK